MTPYDQLFYLGMALLTSAAGLFTFVALAAPITAATSHGARGYQRQRARHNSLFVTSEPLLRTAARWVSALPLGGTRIGIDLWLQKSGHYLGLTADEFLAASLLIATTGMALVATLSTDLVLPAALSMGLLPYLFVSAHRNKRVRAIHRALPSSIELIGLCVSAGMDFGGAIRELISENPDDDDALASEFRQLSRDLDLGQTRRNALKSLADRVDGDAMNDLVSALIQSEEQGTPLGDVLSAQAKMLHLRRSYRAEEMANKAPVKLVIPMAMLMMMLLAIIVVPLMLDLKRNGL